MTAMAGAGVYLDMMAGAGLWESVRRHVEIKGMDGVQSLPSGGIETQLP